MKKAILAIMVCVGACTIMKAQDMPPKPTEDPNGETVRGFHLQRNPAPISPATLLLLGLGASTVGYRVYRNQNND